MEPAPSRHASALHRPRSYSVVPLLRRESIGESYHVLTFEVPNTAPAKPGQFAMLRGIGWGKDPLLPRPMSYLSGGSTPSMLVKMQGAGTIRMAHAEPGESFAVLGPLGNGWRPHDPTRRQVLVAGGVGVAPLLFLARELVAQGKNPVVLYGGRTARDLPLLDDLSELCHLEITTEDGSRGLLGRVTDHLGSFLGPDAEVFTCGPERMMAKVAERCQISHVPCEASLEAPMACGYGVCLGCAVPTVQGEYFYVCSEGPCVDAQRIAWEQPDAPPEGAPKDAAQKDQAT